MKRSERRHFRIEATAAKGGRSGNGEESRCPDNTRITLHALTSSLVVGYVHQVWRYVVNLNSHDCTIYAPALSIRLGRSSGFYTGWARRECRSTMLQNKLRATEISSLNFVYDMNSIKLWRSYTLKPISINSLLKYLLLSEEVILFWVIKEFRFPFRVTLCDMRAIIV